MGLTQLALMFKRTAFLMIYCTVQMQYTKPVLRH